jgi:hypothetical protein
MTCHGKDIQIIMLCSLYLIKVYQLCQMTGHLLIEKKGEMVVACFKISKHMPGRTRSFCEMLVKMHATHYDNI